MIKGQVALAVSCGIEAATGLGLLVAPSMVVKLVLGAEIETAAIVIANIAGLALISLAIACWPRGDTRGGGAYPALLLYNALVGLLLLWTGATVTPSGLLLWPVVVTHLILAALIALALLRVSKSLGGHERGK